MSRDETLSEKRRRASLSRKRRGGGGPRDGTGGRREGAGRPRVPASLKCPCGAMTLKRALFRGHTCGVLLQDLELDHGV